MNKNLLWLIVGKYKLPRMVYIFYSKYKFSLKRIIEHININNSTFQKESPLNMMEVLRYVYNYGVDFDEIYLFSFINKSSKEQSEYLTTYNRLYYYSKLNALKYDSLFTDKYNTYLRYRKYYDRKILLINKDSNDQNGFNSFVENNSKFIYKPLSESSGKGIKIYDVKDYSSTEKLFSELSPKGGLIEELIFQGEELSKLHSNSVNTLRIPQIITNSGEVKIFHPVIRIGRSNNQFDNAGQGGIFATINSKTGVITSDGYDYYGNNYIYHPTSNIKLKGFQLPKWESLEKTIKEIANEIPDVRYIGWDFAFSNNRWVVVEANFEGSFKILQVAKRGGLKEELVKLI